MSSKLGRSDRITHSTTRELETRGEREGRSEEVYSSFSVRIPVKAHRRYLGVFLFLCQWVLPMNFAIYAVEDMGHMSREYQRDGNVQAGREGSAGRQGGIALLIPSIYIHPSFDSSTEETGHQRKQKISYTGFPFLFSYLCNTAHSSMSPSIMSRSHQGVIIYRSGFNCQIDSSYTQNQTDKRQKRLARHARRCIKEAPLDTGAAKEDYFLKTP